jgi:uncharacterized protein (TIGR03790 family)
MRLHPIEKMTRPNRCRVPGVQPLSSHVSLTQVVTALLTVTLLASWSFALEANRTLVLYNAASSEGTEIAAYYAQKRPGVRLLGLNNLPAGEEINSTQYRTILRPQVMAGLTDDIDTIVTTKGMPLRVYNENNILQFPHTYTDPYGVQRTIFADSYKRYSSLESELTRVERFSTWKQMGDQTWWYPPVGFNPSQNLYYKHDGRFNRSERSGDGMRLTSRLDAYTVTDVKAMIDRAQKVFVVPFGHATVVDDSPAALVGDATAMEELVNNVLVPQNRAYNYSPTVSPVYDDERPIIGYVGHGTNDGSGELGPHYITQQLNFRPARGAVLHTWESFNAYSFVKGNNRSDQGLIADWIERGGTAALGHVEEPGGNLANVANEDRFFEMMFAGYTLAEAAWNATNQLSHTNTLIGDPLMTWREWLPADASLDGLVNLVDYSALASNWMGPGTFDTGDFNNDAVVNMLDYNILAMNWLRSADGGTVPGSNLPPPPDINTVPEPSAAIGLVLGVAGALARPHRRRNRA